jgi:hypothetical protein
MLATFYTQTRAAHATHIDALHQTAVFWGGDPHDLHRASTCPYTHTCTHAMTPSLAPRTDRRSHTPSDKEAQWQ